MKNFEIEVAALSAEQLRELSEHYKAQADALDVQAINASLDESEEVEVAFLPRLPIPLPPIKVRINVHNHYPHPIRVVMDSGRETKDIAAGGSATFSKANLGDMPTFHAQNMAGQHLKSKRVAAPGNSTVVFP